MAWPEVEYLDNEGCVDALDRVTNSGPGVLKLLDSQTKSGVGTDADFFLAVNKVHGHSHFFKSVKKARRLASEAFIISHFAGDVCYTLERGSWLERENDSIASDLDAALKASTAPLLSQVLCAPSSHEALAATPRGGGAGATPRGGGGGGGGLVALLGGGGDAGAAGGGAPPLGGSLGEQIARGLGYLRAAARR